jgi:hypothetical protein
MVNDIVFGQPSYIAWIEHYPTLTEYSLAERQQSTAANSKDQLGSTTSFSLSGM